MDDLSDLMGFSDQPNEDSLADRDCPNCDGTGHDDGQCFMCGGTGSAFQPMLAPQERGWFASLRRSSEHAWLLGAQLAEPGSSEEPEDEDLDF